MKNGILAVMIFTMLACLACTHKPSAARVKNDPDAAEKKIKPIKHRRAMARVESGPNGVRIIAPSNDVVKVIESLNDLPGACLEETEALLEDSDPGAATEIDCSTGRFHLQATGSRSRARANNAHPEQLLQGVLVNDYRPNRSADLTLTVNINEASGAPTAYQNISIGPQEQRQLTLKPGKYIVKYRFFKSRWEEFPVSPNSPGFKIILGPS